MFYSVNSYSSASTRKGVSGLISGMDTDELVKGLTMGTQNKISAQLAKKQKASWKQNSYREVTKAINELQNKYFTYSAGKNNLLSSSFFDSSTITNTSKYVKVSGSSTAAKNVQIRDIKDLATTANTTSRNPLSKQSIESGKMYSEWFESAIEDEKFVINVDGEDVSLALTGFKFTPEQSQTAEGRMNAISEALNKAIDNSKYKGKISVEFNADGKFQVNAIADAEGKKPKLGLGYNDSDIKNSNIWGALDIGSMATDASGNLVSAEATKADELVKTNSIKFGDSISGKTLTVSLNGVNKKITFNASDLAQFDTPEKATEYMNKKLGDIFGKNDNGNQKVTAEFNTSTGGMSLKTDNQFDVIRVNSSDAGLLGRTGAFAGIEEGISNRVGWNSSIKEIKNSLGSSLGTPDADGNYKLTINDVDILINEKDSLSTMLKKIENSDAGVVVTYSTTSDALSISAKDSGDIGRINITDTEFSKALFGTAGVDFTNDVRGTNASMEVSFDGGKTYQNITRTSNTFSLDGVNIELLGKAEGTEKEDIKFTVETNTDAIVDKMKEFIKDYNAMVKLMSDKMKETTKKGYTPLTDEQKAEMSETEVKNWEAAAKKGVLGNDQYINKMLTDLRSNLFSKVDGVDFGLSHVGITTTGWAENGQIQMDPAGEEKFRKLLAEDPEAVKTLFTASVGDSSNPDDLKLSGLAVKLEKTFNNFAGTFGGDGIFIGLAGKDTDVYGQDTLSVEMRRADSTLDKLKKTLIAEETRYYKQFANMEKYLSNMNTQSSWLTQQMGG